MHWDSLGGKKEHSCSSQMASRVKMEEPGGWVGVEHQHAASGHVRFSSRRRAGLLGEGSRARSVLQCPLWVPTEVAPGACRVLP